MSSKTVGMTLLKYGKEELPEDLLTNVTQKYTSCAGVALQGYVDKKPVLQVAHLPGLIKPDDPLFKEYKDNLMLLYFGQHSNEEAHNLQPFPLVKDGDGDIVLAGNLIGDFSKFAWGDGLSNAYHAANLDLIPRLQEKYDDSGGDLNKFLAALKKPIFQRDVGELMTSGSVTMLAANNEVLSYDKELTPSKYQFGWTTDNCGYEKKEVVPPGPPKPVSLADKLKSRTKATGTPEPAAPIPELPPELQRKVGATTVIHKGPTISDDKPLPDGVHRVPQAMTFTTPPEYANLSKKEKLAFLKANNVAFPGNKPPQSYKQGGTFALKAPPPIKSLTDDRMKEALAIAAQTGAASPITPEQIEEEKKIAPAPAVPSKPAEEPQKQDLAARLATKKASKKSVPAVTPAPSSIVPLIPSQERIDFVEKFLKEPNVITILNKSGEQVIDPREIPGLETKTSPAHVQLNNTVTFQDICFLLADGNFRRMIVEKYPRAAEVFIFDLLRALAAHPAFAQQSKPEEQQQRRAM